MRVRAVVCSVGVCGGEGGRVKGEPRRPINVISTRPFNEELIFISTLDSDRAMHFFYGDSVILFRNELKQKEGKKKKKNTHTKTSFSNWREW